MSEEVKKPNDVIASAAKQSTEKPMDRHDDKSSRDDNAKSTAPAAAKNGEAPKKKFGAANNFSSDNMAARDDRGNRGRPSDRGRSGGDRRDNRRGNRRDSKPAEEKIFEEQTIAVDRVSRTVKGGRRLRFKALVVVGDKKTRVGVGVAKGRDVQQAVEKATGVAKKHLITIPLAGTTIPHDTEIKHTGAHVLLKPAAPGTGIIAGGVIRSIIGVTGISDLLSKSLGSANKVNIAYATIEALESLVPKSDWIGAEKKKVDSAKTKAAQHEEPAK
ncbi:30S ribosomal protein S5 [Candidatus Saccharibacteria bacterium]|nr:30S ribosomal protein S5 [Candidatus Saccharibacteria bacterium]